MSIPLLMWYFIICNNNGVHNFMLPYNIDEKGFVELKLTFTKHFTLLKFFDLATAFCEILHNRF